MIYFCKPCSLLFSFIPNTRKVLTAPVASTQLGRIGRFLASDNPDKCACPCCHKEATALPSEKDLASFTQLCTQLRKRMGREVVLREVNHG